MRIPWHEHEPHFCVAEGGHDNGAEEEDPCQQQRVRHGRQKAGAAKANQSLRPIIDGNKREISLKEWVSLYLDGISLDESFGSKVGDKRG